MSLRCGFGYDHVNDDYKVVKIVQRQVTFGKNEVEVYSLKTDEDIGSNVCFLLCWGTFVGGALNWIAFDIPTCSNAVVFGFDLGLEQFKKVPLPHLNGTNRTHISLGHVGGSLYITDNYKDSHTNVRLMDNQVAENPCRVLYISALDGSFSVTFCLMSLVLYVVLCLYDTGTGI
ncbi:hypothetical protein POM88_046506 [Heracleum sosnowskyi]|uniref:F-box associated beta-propeller type 3 domain-containing protein n=1 Tax=Heracleum sosnowskyi TaxID=360622 RepID=A0AAD8H6D0_9APIA|nr:hypothetical protein POM88_046506 [Heracleum sosnowskyi]